eukprot:TRINITY_DN13196_c0_g1_i1.p1 TRINITY_DN13196_c0_g1~~TRINITY_DN13196_c0_g1_i1.p1  ORF type:complete len:373 (-),score=72.00 TRINITY_DN13196_c0_g1_i1:8-1126(-)
MYKRIFNFVSAKTAKLDDGVIRIGILGAAKISPLALIVPSTHMSDVAVVAVAARDVDKAKAFAKRWNVPKVHNTYDDLLNDTNIDAVYIPLPNSLHFEWTIKSLEKGKHVLCEKPFSSNALEAKIMLDKANETAKSLVEAFHYRYHPLAQRVKAIVNSGELGEIHHINATFTLPKYITKLSFKSDDIRYNFSLSGGIMMDAGCYPMNMIRMLARDQDPEIISAKPTYLLNPDIETGMLVNMKFPDGFTADLCVDFWSKKWTPEVKLEVIGGKGNLLCTNLILPSLWHKLEITTKTVRGTEIRTESVYGNGHNTYWYQLRAFVDEIKGGPKCETNAEDGWRNMKAIDAVYKAANMKPRGNVLKEHLDEFLKKN